MSNATSTIANLKNNRKETNAQLEVQGKEAVNNGIANAFNTLVNTTLQVQDTIGRVAGASVDNKIYEVGEDGRSLNDIYEESINNAHATNDYEGSNMEKTFTDSMNVAMDNFESNLNWAEKKAFQSRRSTILNNGLKEISASKYTWMDTYKKDSANGLLNTCATTYGKKDMPDVSPLDNVIGDDANYINSKPNYLESDTDVQYYKDYSAIKDILLNTKDENGDRVQEETAIKEVIGEERYKELSDQVGEENVLSYIALKSSEQAERALYDGMLDCVYANAWIQSNGNKEYAQGYVDSVKGEYETYAIEKNIETEIGQIVKQQGFQSWDMIPEITADTVSPITGEPLGEKAEELEAYRQKVITSVHTQAVQDCLTTLNSEEFAKDLASLQEDGMFSIDDLYTMMDKYNMSELVLNEVNQEFYSSMKNIAFLTTVKESLEGSYYAPDVVMPVKENGADLKQAEASGLDYSNLKLVLPEGVSICDIEAKFGKFDLANFIDTDLETYIKNNFTYLKASDYGEVKIESAQDIEAYALIEFNLMNSLPTNLDWESNSISKMVVSGSADGSTVGALALASFAIDDVCKALDENGNSDISYSIRSEIDKLLNNSEYSDYEKFEACCSFLDSVGYKYSYGNGTYSTVDEFKASFLQQGLSNVIKYTENQVDEYNNKIATVNSNGTVTAGKISFSDTMSSISEEGKKQLENLCKNAGYLGDITYAGYDADTLLDKVRNKECSLEVLQETIKGSPWVSDETKDTINSYDSTREVIDTALPDTVKDAIDTHASNNGTEDLVDAVVTDVVTSHYDADNGKLNCDYNTVEKEVEDRLDAIAEQYSSVGGLKMLADGGAEYDICTTSGKISNALSTALSTDSSWRSGDNLNVFGTTKEIAEFFNNTTSNATSIEHSFCTGLEIEGYDESDYEVVSLALALQDCGVGIGKDNKVMSVKEAVENKEAFLLMLKEKLDSEDPNGGITASIIKDRACGYYQTNALLRGLPTEIKDNPKLGKPISNGDGTFSFKGLEGVKLIPNNGKNGDKATVFSMTDKNNVTITTDLAGLFEFETKGSLGNSILTSAENKIAELFRASSENTLFTQNLGEDALITSTYNALQEATSEINNVCDALGINNLNYSVIVNFSESGATVDISKATGDATSILIGNMKTNATRSYDFKNGEIVGEYGLNDLKKMKRENIFNTLKSLYDTLIDNNGNKIIYTKLKEAKENSGGSGKAQQNVYEGNSVIQFQKPIN